LQDFVEWLLKIDPNDSRLLFPAEPSKEKLAPKETD